MLDSFFKKAYNKQWGRMSKQELARMVYNLSYNYGYLYEQHNLGAKIWLKTKKQRDWFKLRSRERGNLLKRHGIAEDTRPEDSDV